MPASFSFSTGTDQTIPVITPLAPLAGSVGVAPRAHVLVRMADDDHVDPTTTLVLVNGTQYVNANAAVNGATAVITANLGNGYDFDIALPMAFPVAALQTVVASCRDLTGNATQTTYSFNTSTPVSLLSVENPMEGILVARFSTAMLGDAALLDIGNWRIVPVSPGARELSVVGVAWTPARPSQVVLRYSGGGSQYQLVVGNLRSQNLDPIAAAFSSSTFELLYGTPFEPTVKLFDSIFGPLGIAQRMMPRRHIDRLLVNRAIALAMDQQLAIKLAGATDGTAGRDGRPGVSRT
jgi:hypothetical protein